MSARRCRPSQPGRRLRSGLMCRSCHTCGSAGGGGEARGYRAERAERKAASSHAQEQGTATQTTRAQPRKWGLRSDASDTNRWGKYAVTGGGGGKFAQRPNAPIEGKELARHAQVAAVGGRRVAPRGEDEQNRVQHPARLVGGVGQRDGECHAPPACRQEPVGRGDATYYGHATGARTGYDAHKIAIR